MKNDSKNNQSSEANSTDKNNLKNNPLMKPFLGCASSTMSMAIGFSGLAVYAAEPLPVAAQNTTFKPNTPLHTDASSKNHAIANFDINSDMAVLNHEAILNKKPHQASAQDLPATSKEPTHSVQTLKQSTSSSAKPSIESTEPVPRDRIVQVDTLTPQPSEPSSEADPESNDGSEEPQRERWQFSVEPYFFVPLSVQADVTAAGRSASLDLGLDDVLNLDRAFDAGLRLEAQHDRLGFILDAFYISAAQSGNVGVTFPEESLQRFGINTAARVDGDVSLSIDEITIDTAVSYRVIDTVLGNSTTSSTTYPRLIVAPILGLRTRILWQELELDSVRIGDISLPLEREFSSSKTTIEPLLGTQIGLDLSRRWAINFRGDVSGFNINAEQDFTWNLLIGTQYHLSPNMSLQLAYRFNGFDYENGEGIRRTRLNLYQNGLWLSGIFRF